MTAETGLPIPPDRAKTWHPTTGSSGEDVMAAEAKVHSQGRALRILGTLLVTFGIYAVGLITGGWRRAGRGLLVSTSREGCSERDTRPFPSTTWSLSGA
jgi:hypothetical protein